MGVGGGARGRAINDVLLAVHFVDCGYSLGRGVDFRLPQPLARVDIQRTDLPIARACEDQSSRRHHRTHLWKMAARLREALRRELRHLAERYLPRDRSGV